MAAVHAFCLSFTIVFVLVLTSIESAQSGFEIVEIARGKPITATSTCGALASEVYCYSTDLVGQECDVCYGDNRIESVTAADRSTGYWQSAVQSNRSTDERVEITINLNQEFYIRKISVATAFTPQPSIWVIEGSRNNGKSYATLVYLVSNPDQCQSVNATKFDDGLCIVQEPVRNGSSERVVVSFDENVIADHLRLSYLEMWQTTNLELLQELSRFYTLKEISVQGVQAKEGRTSARTKRQAPCYCSRIGTAGSLCNAPRNRVCPCKRKFTGRRCNKCARNYFNYPSCLPCRCSREGSVVGSACKRRGGQCRCKPTIVGRKCDRCIRGYSGFPTCRWCGCYMDHTKAVGCDTRGKCVCKENYDGKTCGKCKLGYADYPNCTKLACTCPSPGSVSIKCDAAGQCVCKEGVTGPKCDRCKDGYFGFPQCKQCACNYKGSVLSECDPVTGKCVCFPSIGGRQCDRCESGHFGFPRCRSCVCNPYGTKPGARRGNGVCPTGKEKFNCRCKANVGGETCDICKDLHYGFSPRNPVGCKSCGCFKGATIGGLKSCDQRTGKCSCKPFVEGTKCYECKRGYHSLKAADIFGCKACKCNPGGALYGNCDKRDGACRCRPNVDGKRCDRLSRGSVYFPSLHHISAEVEDGKTLDGKPVKYNFNSNIFPSFSWKGYVNFSPDEEIVVVSINIPRRSLYRILFRCIFEPVGFPSTTDIRFTISPGQGTSGYTRIVSMTLSSTQNRQKGRSSFLTVSQNNVTQEILMFDGKWTVTIECESKYLLMDYLVFLPEEYFTGRILNTQRVDPCVLDGRKDEICDLYSYPEVADEHVVKHEAENGYFAKKPWGKEKTLSLKYYSKKATSRHFKGNRLVLMNKEQNRFAVDMDISKAGYYVFVVHYISLGEHLEKIDIYVHRQRGAIHIVPCKYQFGCRQVVMKDVKVVKVFDLDKGLTPLNLFTSKDARIAIDYVTAIPFDLWHPDYITPALVCRSLQDKCIKSKYEKPTKFEQHRPASRSVVDSPRPNSPLRNSGKDKLVRFREFFNKKIGNFVIVLQYQQTKNVIVRGLVSITTYRTKLRGVAEFKYCPNTEFCRIVVKTEDDKEYFRIRQGTTTVEVRFPVNMNVQVSWLFKIPANSYSENVLSFTPIDNSLSWREQCSQNNFIIDPNAANYCRKTSFALVTSFNNGAWPCRCSYRGSRSRFCNRVHGQCNCRRPNIIGRQCLQCASGYYGFPYCRRCACDPRGVDIGNCDRFGRCRCKPNFAGINCDRCKPTYYDFPTCKPCNCDNYGSLSTFCTSSGQCQCRRPFAGKRCDKCRVGFYGFPDCKECNCHASGMKPIPGLSSGCNSSLAVECKCKENVAGKLCNTCKDLYYNLQFNNPKGCSKCTCSSRGTTGQLKKCDKLSGQCTCKKRVGSRSCSVCKDGSTLLQDYSIFGCKGCECDYGGSWDNICDKTSGKCSCKRNVGGKKCTRVKSDGFYVKTLHHIRAEFEDGSTNQAKRLRIRYSESEFPGFSGRGYVPVSNAQSSFDVFVQIPRPTKYRLLIRYVLDSWRPTFGQVTISPTGENDPLPKGYKSVQVTSIQFKPTSTRRQTYAEFFTVEENGKVVEFFLTRGKWRVSLYGAPSKLLLDYLVMIPEEYYKATHLRRRVERPCTVDSKLEENCVDYKYLPVTIPDAIKIASKLGQLVGRRTLLPNAPFKTSSVLTQESQLYLPIPIQKFGAYVLMVTYYQEAKIVSDLIVSVTSGFNDQSARIRTFYCKYTFGCRQVAIDDENKVISFDLFPNTRNLLSIGAQTTVAVESITIIPKAKWSTEYIEPAEYCVRTKKGCVVTTHDIHSRAIRVDAEKNGQGMKPSLALDSAVRAVFLAGDGMSLRIKSEIGKARYKILVHYFQPSYGKFKGRIIVATERSTALYLQFNFCPNVGGCRAQAFDKFTGMGRSLYIKKDVDITLSIPSKSQVWIDYILFVPSRHYSASMENQQPMSLAKEFLNTCANNNFIVDKSSSFCKQLTFTMTTLFNGEVSPCKCDRNGAVSSVCDKFGGQCRCKQNIVGRKCDKCKGGYSGFPNCRRR